MKRTVGVWYSGLAPMATEWTGSSKASVRSEPSLRRMRMRSSASDHSCSTRWSTNGSTCVMRRPAWWGTRSTHSAGAGLSQGAVTTLKSGASRLVRMTKRSPQWSSRYSTSGWRSATSCGSASGWAAGSTSTSVEVLASLVMMTYAPLRHSSRSTL